MNWVVLLPFRLLLREPVVVLLELVVPESSECNGWAQLYSQPRALVGVTHGQLPQGSPPIPL